MRINIITQMQRIFFLAFRVKHNFNRYYLLVQRQKREIYENTVIKKKNLRVSSLSTTWTQRSEGENSPYSCRDKVSRINLQSNELAPQQQDNTEKK